MSNPKPTLIFDKDAFQGISRQAHERLAELYEVIVHPPLMNEVAGDYVEGKPNGHNTSPAEHVITLIRKFGGRYTFSSASSALCIRELRGEALRLEGTAYTQRHMDVFDVEGNSYGIVAREGNDTVPVWERWADRVLARKHPLAPAGIKPHIDFTAEAVLSEAFPLLERLDTPASNDDLAVRVRNLIADQCNARALLRFVADWSTPEGKPREKVRLDAQGEWRRRGRPAFTAYPYSARCAQVALLYVGGVRVKGKPREVNDRGDLEHLKHLPFASVFASDDKLVREIARHLVRPDQRLVTRQQLIESFAPGADRLAGQTEPRDNRVHTSGAAG